MKAKIVPLHHPEYYMDFNTEGFNAFKHKDVVKFDNGLYEIIWPWWKKILGFCPVLTEFIHIQK